VRMQDSMIAHYNRSPPCWYRFVVCFCILLQVNCLPLTRCRALCAINSPSELLSEPCSRYGGGSLASIKHPASSSSSELSLCAGWSPAPQQPGETDAQEKKSLNCVASRRAWAYATPPDVTLLSIHKPQPLVSRARIAARSYALSARQNSASLLIAGLS
jgi:hypothetical protein